MFSWVPVTSSWGSPSSLVTLARKMLTIFRSNCLSSLIDDRFLVLFWNWWLDYKKVWKFIMTRTRSFTYLTYYQEENHAWWHEILNNPFLNKGPLFTMEERKELGLLGILPPYVQTIEEQAEQAYQNFYKPSNLENVISWWRSSTLTSNLLYMSGRWMVECAVCSVWTLGSKSARVMVSQTGATWYCSATMAVKTAICRKTAAKESSTHYETIQANPNTCLTQITKPNRNWAFSGIF